MHAFNLQDGSLSMTGIRPLPAPMQLMRILILFAGLSACSSLSASQSGMKRIKVRVGQLKEISLPAPASSTRQLSGSSDNDEIADVSEKQRTATAPGRTGRNQNNMIFLIKGITPGTAKVVFTEKQTGEEGPGEARITYQVEVVSR